MLSWDKTSRSILQHTQPGYERSTVLQPLLTLIGISVVVFVPLAIWAPLIITYIVLGIIGVLILAFLYAYFYSFHTNQSAIRSEKFNVRMEHYRIQERLIGDDNAKESIALMNDFQRLQSPDDAIIVTNEEKE